MKVATVRKCTGNMIEGSLEVKLPTIWTDEKQRWEESERREEQKREDQRRESVRRKKMQMREKVGKSRNTVFFQWFVAPEGRKVGSLKRRVRSHLARWEMKNCTPLWREARFQVKMYKAYHSTTFGSCDVEKVHAVVARSTFEVKMYKTHQLRTTFGSWDVEKVHGCCGAKQISKSKCTKHTILGPLAEVEMSKKCTPLWREAHFEVKMLKTLGLRTTFGGSDVVSHGRRKGLCTLSRVSKTWGFCRISKNDGRRGTFEEDLQRCIFRGRRSTRDIFIRAVRRSGHWFPERGFILEPEIFSFGKMILRNRCSTSYDLASLFHGSCRSRNLLVRGRRALQSTFHFWRKSRRIALFLMLSSSKIKKSRRIASFWMLSSSKIKKSRRIASFLMLSTSRNEEVSQTCFVFDVVMCKHWGRLGELLRVWCCQRWTMRKSRRIAWLSSLQIDR